MSLQTRRLMQSRRSRILARGRRNDRRGVLLMVVLSMLALFLLLGTAFLVSSQFYADTAKEASKLNRTNNNPADLLERAMLQVVRDTNNQNSAIRYHSLLRDVYGNDGFIGRVYDQNLAVPVTATASNYALPNYSGDNGAGTYGPTAGQFIDLYVADRNVTSSLPSSTNVIKLERNPDGSTADHILPSATDYYAGCLLTMLNGQAAGQTTRVLDYDLVGYTSNNEPVYRLRVMSFSKADGQSFTPNELQLLANNSFMVNGRAHNGTGAGYNRLAATGEPRLSAVELSVVPSGVVGGEIALMPNSRFVNINLAAHFLGLGIADPFTGSYTASDFQPIGLNGATSLYPTAEGPGGSDESYDAVDYQNMFLAHMPLTPRARGALIDGNGNFFEINSQPGSALINDQSRPMRLDLENTIIPSFHRPALVNYWYHRLMNSSWLSGVDENERARLILQPYEARNPGDAVADAIVALKRKISLRPIVEDHPNFDGSNPASRYSGTLSPAAVTTLAANGQIRFPFWEAVGPWDVDNDNDGINDSVWVDLGDAVQETENGTLYKPLYAFLVVDLDNRLNLNVHGSPDHFAATDFDPLAAQAGVTNVGNLTGIGASSNVMPVGMGWGPGDITLRSILSPLTQPFHGNYLSGLGTNTPFDGVPLADDYARLLFGRVSIDQNSDAIWGRMGTTVTRLQSDPGRSFVSDGGLTGNVANDINTTREPMLPYDFLGYPVIDQQRAERIVYNTGNTDLLAYMSPTPFGSSPDLRGRYATGVDYTGQPVYEAIYDDRDIFAGQPIASLVDDSPYETNASSNSRRGLPGAVTLDDDALFATSEMERVLRAYDAESGTAPSRLYDIVDAFDPNKYVLTVTSTPASPSPEELALAQVNTAINRQQVTTDSYEVPVPASAVPSYITELGPDGAPGIAGEDDDENGVVDDVSEVGMRMDSNAYVTNGVWPDDFATLTGKSVTEARLVDVVWYRIQRNRISRGLPPYNIFDPAEVAALNNICDQLLPPEVLAGYKMDINRPFGDGQDNNGNGIVDEPLEAGEPFADEDGSGTWHNEPFMDLNGNGGYDGPLDRLWKQQLAAISQPPALVDYVMSKDVSGRGSYIDANGNGTRDFGEVNVQPGDATLRDDAHLARQLYARHLYVLMLVLMDEDYLAPYDPSDPSVQGYLRIKASQLGNTPADKIEAQRRYTYRQVAQWAVNCVDFRDADASNTPFEYDANPWDGWNTVNDGGNADPTDDIYYPLDGDATTDENYAQVVDWANMAADGVRVITNPVPTWGNNSNQLDDRNATRGIVWGAERPELLISETAAFHDLRQEDLATSANEGDNTTVEDTPEKPRDQELDQRLEPRGSLYVEVYNPWSGDAPLPVELYRHGHDRDGDGTIEDEDIFHWVDLNGNNQYDPNERFEGVLLDRLSNQADSSGRRSPVWRIIVVEEHPGYHSYAKSDVNQPSRDDNQSHAGNLDGGGNFNRFLPLLDYRQVLNSADQERQQIPYISPTNMDWDEMFFNPLLTTPAANGSAIVWPAAQWQQERTRQANQNSFDPKGDPANFNKQLFAKPYPYIEREFYFTSGNTPFFAHARNPSTGNSQRWPRATARSYSDFDTVGTIGGQLRDRFDETNVRIPFPLIKLGRQTAGGQELVSFAHRFIATQPDGDRPDVPIAPIMPGRYGVIGDSGTLYQGNNRVEGIFITTLGRNAPAGAGASRAQTDDLQHVSQITGVRRMEMRPSGNPLEQQWLVGSNGGYFGVGDGPTARFNELMNLPNQNNSGKNMTTEGDTFSLQTASEVMAPVVVVPVDDMNISEPAYGYGVRARELTELHETSGKGDQGHTWNPTAANGEGAFEGAAGGGGTNSLHFDLPFDDEPGFNQAHRRPVRLKKYRVVHLQRLADPTMPWNPPPGYNEADRAKRAVARHDPALPVNPYLTVDSASVDLTIFNGASSTEAQPPQGDTLYRSTERMHQARRSLGFAAAAVPQRALWAQDFFMAPLNVFGSETTGETGVVVNNRRDRMPQDARMDHGVSPNHFDYIFRHSLGLPNEAAGSVYMQPERAPDALAEDPTDIDGVAQLAGAAAGAPRPDGAIASTYPWLNWNNRPFVSENELLQVPAWSSMEMLRKFSTMNPNQPVNESNSYEGGWAARRGPSDTDPIDAEKTNAERYKRTTARFGHLLNILQSFSESASIEFDPTTGDPACIGAANFHRILDYVHTPSRFVATDTLLDPTAFSVDNVASLDDPRAGNLAPFNRVPNYREPGKVNLNTVRGQRIEGLGVWSEVFDGLMHRVRDGDPLSFPNATGYGHFGPAWRDVILSRRGYDDPLATGYSIDGPDRSPLVLRNDLPTFFAKPFRSPTSGDLVPIEGLLDGGVDVSMLRSHPLRPDVNPAGYQWGNPGDDDGWGLTEDSREAINIGGGPPVPLFSELCSTPAIDATRNSAMHYMPLTRLDNLTTTRSGVFAIWVTVGYFEVTPAPEFADQIAQKFTNQAGGDPDLGRVLYNKVYPQGYQLGKELGSETGDIDRHRAFYIIDRTRPVAFKPGEDVNVEDAILLRRRID